MPNVNDAKMSEATTIYHRAVAAAHYRSLETFSREEVVVAGAGVIARWAETVRREERARIATIVKNIMKDDDLRFEYGPHELRDGAEVCRDRVLELIRSLP